MRHLLSTQDLSLHDAIRILDTAEEMAAVGEREVKKLPALRGEGFSELAFEITGFRSRNQAELGLKGRVAKSA